MDFSKVLNCFAQKIFAECDIKSDYSDCVETKNEANICMASLGIAATTTLKESDVRKQAETEAGTTAATNVPADSH